MIAWHARVYNLRKYRPTTAYRIKLGKSGTRRSPDTPVARGPQASKYPGNVADSKRGRPAPIIPQFARQFPVQPRRRLQLPSSGPLSRAGIRRILERPDTFRGVAHMQSRLRQPGRSPAIRRWLGLPLLVLALIAKPEDWQTRGQPNARSDGEWNTEPKANWWQYTCPIDDNFFQCPEMPKEDFQYCPKHKLDVVMVLVNNPSTG